MKFLQSLTSGLKEAVGIEKKWDWGEEEMQWFHKFGPQLSALKAKILKRSEKYTHGQVGVPLISRSEFVELCREILTKDFDLDSEELREINFDDVFETHLRAQGGQFGDNLEAVCFVKCLVTPFREPSNFFYFFALSDTNKSGGLDPVEFKRMLQNKFKKKGPKGSRDHKDKVEQLMEEYFPSDEPDNALYSFFKKLSGKTEVSIVTYVQAFPQDLFQECTCYEYIHQCIAAH